MKAMQKTAEYKRIVREVLELSKAYFNRYLSVEELAGLIGAPVQKVQRVVFDLCEYGLLNRRLDRYDDSVKRTA